MKYPSFNAGATLAFLDDLAIWLEPVRLSSIEHAWDAAWIVCMTVGPRHKMAAQTALASVVEEMNRLSIAHAPGEQCSNDTGAFMIVNDGTHLAHVAEIVRVEGAISWLN